MKYYFRNILSLRRKVPCHCLKIQLEEPELEPAVQAGYAGEGEEELLCRAQRKVGRALVRSSDGEGLLLSRQQSLQLLNTIPAYEILPHVQDDISDGAH